MVVFKSSVVVRDGQGEIIGEGMTYVHLRRPHAEAQDVTGTVSLQWWEPVGEPPTEVTLADGRRLPIVVSRDVLSDCSQSRIFRYRASWPPYTSPVHQGGSSDGD
jgi:hypothetical protein